MTKFKLRRVEVEAGPSMMLRTAGWTYSGPAGHEDTEIGEYWINPRSQRKYTRSGAVAIEELREAM